MRAVRTYKKIDALKKYFKKEPSVLLAFVFGSVAKKRQTKDSDFDIAVYLTDKKQEDKICFEATKIVEREVDIVNLKEAPATLISNVFKTGISLVIKDKKLYWELYLNKTTEAEDFLRFVEDYWRIYQEARSLIPEEKTRALQRIQFLQSELAEIELFKELTFEEYQSDKNKRRSIERWTENILNSTIDIAKIILASEKKKIPKTYEEALFDFAIFVGLSRQEATEFARFANLRNILAHEYLDVLFGRIQNFIKQAPLFYKEIFQFLGKYLEKS